MKLSIDRKLPVPLGVQLRGLIEYGIACGQLQAGEQLPSIRELADSIGVAPMTISQVYRDLKKAGLIKAQTGSGTFVADASHTGRSAASGTVALSRRMDVLIDDALANGVRAGELVSLFNAHVFHRATRAPVAQLAMVGVFHAATARYARLIERHLGAAATVEPVTLDTLARDPGLRARMASMNLAITFVNKHSEVEALLPETPVVAVSFIPSEETRLALASLDSLARVGAISVLPDFLPIMCSGVQRFAPHVENLSAAILGTPEADTLLKSAGVIVYATGAESILDRLRPGVAAIEYRHIPDPADIERVIVPMIRDRDADSPRMKKEAS